MKKEKIKKEIISIGITLIIGLPIASIIYLEVMGKSILPELPSSFGGMIVKSLAFGIPYWLVIFSMIFIYIAFINLIFAIDKRLKMAKSMKNFSMETEF